MPEPVLQIPGIHIERPVYESFRTIVYRGTRHEGGAAVAIKCPRSDYPAAADLARLRNEFEISRGIDRAGVIRAEQWGSCGNRSYLVSPYLEGPTLADLIRARPPLDELLPLMVQLTAAVAEIHGSGVVHKDLAPANVLIERGAHSLRIIDFDIASPLRREHQQTVAPGALEGTLRYMSPEQTGRMNRALDHRSDLYSLGAMFYELLTGSPLFDAEDATELVHHHIAKRPVFPHRARELLPEPLQDLVSRLLLKCPEDRYQSAEGVRRDLERCLVEWTSRGAIAPFQLGQEDVSDHFVVGQRLHGRAAESERLRQVVAEVSAGGKRMVLISGPSGVGKTSLGREVHAAVLERTGIFAGGRSDPQQGHRPYGVVTRALAEVVRQIVSAGPDARAEWQRRILEAVGPSARALVDLFPELRGLTGPLGPLPSLEPQAAQSRLQEAFRKLIGVLADPQHPLVLFLDDLQEADASALGLVGGLLLDEPVKHLLIIGAYRPSEVGPDHPLRALVQRLQRGAPAPVEIALGPLSEADVCALAADTLRARPEEVLPLAQLIHQRTDGNALYLVEYLEFLHRQELIAFQPGRGRWGFDLDGIRRRGVSDGLVELVRAKIQQTPDATRRALQVGACIGARFELDVLAAVLDSPEPALREALVQAVGAGILVLLGPAYQLHEPGPGGGAGLSLAFSFVHERVRTAAYQLLAAEERKQLHRRIAQVLCQGGEPPEERLFQVVDHINQAWELLESSEERRLGLRMNLLAARQAKRGAAYDVALRCTSQTLAQLPPAAWLDEYELTRDLHLERAECEYLAGGRAAARTVIEETLGRVKTAVERSACYRLLIPLQISEGRVHEALQMGARALQELGIDLPLEPSAQAVQQAIVAVTGRLESFDRGALLAQLPPADPQKLAGLQLLDRLAPAAYFTDPGLYALMHCRLLQQALDQGPVRESAQSHAVYAMIEAAHHQRYFEARGHGELAIELADRLGSAQTRGVCRALFGCFVGHWTADSEASVQMLDEAWRTLRDAGDVVMASFALCFQAVTLFMQGAPLAQVHEAVEQSLGYLRRAGYQDLTTWMESLRQVLRALQGETAAPTRLDDAQFGESQARQAMMAMGTRVPLHHHLVAKMQLHYLFGEPDQAARLIPASEELMPLSWSALCTAEHRFFAALSALVLCGQERLSPGEREAHRQTAARAQEQMRVWAASAPGNFMAKHLLLEAEAARVDGAHHRALDLYEGALDVASERRNLPLEALAAELSGRFHLGLRRRMIAGTYLRHAHYSYARWGASAKVAELERRYGNLLERAGGSTARYRAAKTAATEAAQQDLSAISKATRAIAEEIVLERLVLKVVRILVENAGAQAGYLIFPRRTQLHIGVRAHVDEAPGAVLVDQPLASNAEVSPAIVQRALQEESHLLYADAASEPDLARDPVVSRRKPRSVLCFPVTHLGCLSCVVYLENNLAPGVFTARHVEVLRMLSAQAAISLENARAYEELGRVNQELEQRVEERTAELRRANADLESFTHSVSHDMRAPLRAIDAFLQIIQEDHGERLDADSRELFGRVRAAALRLATLIDSLLSLSQIGRGAMSTGPVDMTALATAVVEELKAGLPVNRAVRVTLSELPGCRGDATLLRQVFVNLVANAFKFTQKRDLAVVEVGHTDTENGPAYFVRDNGAGFDMKYVERLFGVFQRLHRQSEFPGSGIGLSIVQRVVQRHGGRIWARSAPDQGATFYFTLEPSG
jgi:predicted ATPase/signal transduction histidine kinase